MSETAVPKSEEGFTYLDEDLVEEFNAYDPVHGPIVKNLYKNRQAHDWCAGIGAGVTGIAFWRSLDTIDSKLPNTKIVKGFIKYMESIDSNLPKTQRIKGIDFFRIIVGTAGLFGTLAGAALGIEVAEKWYPISRQDSVLEAEAKYNTTG